MLSAMIFDGLRAQWAAILGRARHLGGQQRGALGQVRDADVPALAHPLQLGLQLLAGRDRAVGLGGQRVIGVPARHAPRGRAVTYLPVIGTRAESHRQGRRGGFHREQLQKAQSLPRR